MNESVVTVFEYGYLSHKVSDHRCVLISKVAFEYLEGQCLQQDDNGSSLLKLCSLGGHKALQVRNYVGVIHTPVGLQVEILPKTSRGEAGSEDQSRAALLNMLRHLHSFRHIETTDSSIATRSMPLLEVFIRQFLQSVNYLIKRGLRSEYVRREDNQVFMKGKLLSSKQLRHNLVNQHRFYVEYDEYLQDRPVNRLIHSALHKVAGFTRSNANQKLCRELSFAFNEVPLSRDVKQDFSAMKLTRGMEYYQKPLAWARLILEGYSPLSMHGQANAISLLFPMEAVFESYVASILRKQLAQPFWLKEQASQHSLVKFGTNNWFRLKPDLLIMNHKKPQFVLDTKWKLLNESQNNGSEKFGLSQADFYQMFAYGHKYLGGEGQMALIYPKTEQFRHPINHSFNFSERLRLWILPFDIANGVLDGKRLMLPSEESLKKALSASQ